MASIAWSATLSINDSGDAGYSFRNLFPSSLLLASGSQVRVRFRASTASALAVAHASIGQQAGSGDPYDTGSTPVELLFGGVSGFSIASSGTATSDWLTFSLQSANSYVLILDITTGNVRYSNAVTGATWYYKAASATYNVANTSGFTAQSNAIAGIDLIEVQTPGFVRLVGGGVTQIVGGGIAG